MHLRLQPAWLVGIPVLAMTAYVSALVVPAVVREVVPAVVKAVLDSL